VAGILGLSNFMKRSSISHFWSISDLIRLEVYRLLDRGKDPSALQERDRKVFIESQDSSASRSSFFKHWLAYRDEEAKASVDYGRLFQQSLNWFSILLIFWGLALGVSACAALIQYDGSIPVNVSNLLGLLILPQLFLILIQFGLLLLSLLYRPSLSALWWLPKRLFLICFKVVWSFFSRNGRPIQSSHAKVEIEFEDIKEAVSLHGRVLGWKFYTVSQLFGIVFYVGVLGYLLLALFFSDRAFGWQSSIVEDPETIQQIAKHIASPWSWVLDEGMAYPNIDQIEGSRIILNEKSDRLDPIHLGSWWPFLTLTIGFYGLLPRILTWFFGSLIALIIQSKISFDSFSYYSIWSRAASSSLDIHGLPVNKRANQEESSGNLMVEALKGSYRLWFEEGIGGRYDRAMLETQCLDVFGSRAVPISEYKSLLIDLELSQEYPALVVEAWQPPIEEKLEALNELSHRLKDAQMLLLLLIGKPGKTGEYAPSPDMIQNWTLRVQSLRRSNIQILPLKPTNSRSNST
jgi:hypothetical protein